MLIDVERDEAERDQQHARVWDDLFVIVLLVGLWDRNYTQLCGIYDDEANDLLHGVVVQKDDHEDQEQPLHNEHEDEILMQLILVISIEIDGKRFVPCYFSIFLLIGLGSHQSDLPLLLEDMSFLIILTSRGEPIGDGDLIEIADI